MCARACACEPLPESAALSSCPEAPGSSEPRGTHRQQQTQCRREAASRWGPASPPPGQPGRPASAGRWHPGPLPAFTPRRPTPALGARLPGALRFACSLTGPPLSPGCGAEGLLCGPSSVPGKQRPSGGAAPGPGGWRSPCAGPLRSTGLRGRGAVTPAPQTPAGLPWPRRRKSGNRRSPLSSPAPAGSLERSLIP